MVTCGIQHLRVAVLSFNELRFRLWATFQCAVGVCDQSKTKIRVVENRIYTLPRVLGRLLANTCSLPYNTRLCHLSA